jgi:hypothetical protein
VPLSGHGIFNGSPVVGGSRRSQRGAARRPRLPRGEPGDSDPPGPPCGRDSGPCGPWWQCGMRPGPAAARHLACSSRWDLPVGRLTIINAHLTNVGGCLSEPVPASMAFVDRTMALSSVVSWANTVEILRSIKSTEDNSTEQLESIDSDWFHGRSPSGP